MNALNRIAVVGLVAGSISACGLIDPDSIAQTPAPADPFLAALSDEACEEWRGAWTRGRLVGAARRSAGNT